MSERGYEKQARSRPGTRGQSRPSNDNRWRWRARGLQYPWRRWRAKRKFHSKKRRYRKRPARRLHPEILTRDEVYRLLGACLDTFSGFRNRALIATLYRTGLRINEALHVFLKDVDLHAGSIRVLYGKGGTARTVGLDAAAIQYLVRWLQARRTVGIDDNAPLFCLLDSRPVSAAYVRVLLPRLRRKAGIAKRVHAHGLRHTHAAVFRRGDHRPRSTGKLYEMPSTWRQSGWN